MDRDSPYYRQVQLLVQVLPFIFQEQCFALKGGTAINLFVRDFLVSRWTSIWCTWAMKSASRH